MTLEELKTKFNLESLFRQLEGRKLDIFSEYAFINPSDYAEQRPSVSPLGELHLLGNDGGRGMGQRWTNSEETIYVDTDQDGVIKWVFEA